MSSLVAPSKDFRERRRGRSILQIFQKKLRSPVDHRPKYFTTQYLMALSINFSFLFKAYL